MKLLAKEKILFYFIIAVFSLLYLFLVFNNRYAADDHWFVYNAKLRGIIGAEKFVYETWTPRPTEILLLNTLSVFLPEKTVIVLYGLSVFVLLFFIVRNYLTLICKSFKIEISKSDLLIFSFVFISLFFFSCFSIDETWFWLCSSMG